MTRSRTAWALAFGVLLAAPPARADVDLTGTWQVQVEGQPSYSGVWTFTRLDALASTLEAQLPFGAPWSGHLTPETGHFEVVSASQPCTNPYLGKPRVEGTVAESGVTFEATLKVSDLYVGGGMCIGVENFPISAQRICGNGAIDADEQCDDGNARSGDCCSDTCQIAPIGAACGACGTCNAAATCVPEPIGTICGPCSTCDAVGACVLAPRPEAACKRPVRPRAAKLSVKNLSPDTKDTLQWKWAKGATTTLADYGPLDADDDYTLCAFDLSSATPAFVFGAQVPGGSGWSAKPTGFGYKSTTLAPDGIQTVTLKAGAAGKATAIVKGKGDLLPLSSSASPLPLPLLVQLQRDQGGCWEARFDSATLNDGAKFKAVGE